MTAPLVAWLRMPRPEADPGIWRCGYQPRAAEDPDRVPTRKLLAGAVISALVGWLVWSLLYNGYLGSYWIWPLVVLTPDSWRGTMAFVVSSYVYYALFIGGIAFFFGRLGHWPTLLSRAWKRIRGLNDSAAATAAVNAVTGPRNPDPLSDPAQWPQLRADGATQAADRLSAELRDGRLNDVDYARIDHAWRSGRARNDVIKDVLAQGAAACLHGSGDRDLPFRTARHDLVLRQVRVGTAVDAERNPYEIRGAGRALDPTVLGTSALMVGPSGSDSTRVLRPIVESLCLQALSGQAAVVAVTSSGAAVSPDSAFDLVVRIGNPNSAYGLDLYASTEDADEAAGMLAEALVGDLADSLPGGDSRRAATALAQLIGPWRAVHGAFPRVAELRDLLDGATAFTELRTELEAQGLAGHLREVDAYERRLGTPGDPSTLLAHRVALLDRPAFDGVFTPDPEAAGSHLFSFARLDRPVRVRIDLPERAHADASRILARLILAQFTACTTARANSSLFTFLAFEDAVQTVTPYALRGLQRLRASRSGVLLSLGTLGDVPEQLRGPLLGAVGCRIACSGITPWDAEHFAAAWGTEWVETRTVTHREVRSDEPFTRFLHGVKKLMTGRYVTTEAVTVKREQRQRWSASDLANDLHPGHVVLSVTTVRGDRTPPILTKLGE
ncbi:ATP-binding protein [Streptomyces sp. NPDC054863]